MYFEPAKKLTPHIHTLISHVLGNGITEFEHFINWLAYIYQNKNKAMTVLRSRLLQKKQSEEKEKYAQNRKDQVGTGDRSERIRTYNYPQSRITDHRVNYTSHALQETMMGELDHLISFLEKEDLHKKLSSLDGRSNE